MPEVKFSGERTWFEARHDPEDYELRIRTYWMDGRPQLDLRWFRKLTQPNGASFWVPTKIGLRVPFDMKTLLEKGLSLIPIELEPPDEQEQR